MIITKYVPKRGGSQATSSYDKRPASSPNAWDGFDRTWQPDMRRRPQSSMERRRPISRGTVANILGGSARQPGFDHSRHGEFLTTLGCPRPETFRCECPPGGKASSMKHPGLIMPSVMQSTQAMFGTLANKAGHPNSLRYLSGAVPKQAPAYMTHNTCSMSSSGVSNFRKSGAKLFNDDGIGSKAWRSEYRGRFDNKWTDDDDEDLTQVGRT